jgi:hypothetical protein
MIVVDTLLVLTVLGVIWPLRQILWFPLAVCAVAALANL